MVLDGAAQPTVLVVGTFDTKAVELVALADSVEASGASVVFLDTSALATSEPPSEMIRGRRFVTQREVAQAAGTTIERVSALPRGAAVERLRAGVSALLAAYVSEGLVDGVVCMGGAGTHIAGPAIKELPLGFPKLVVSPLASGSRTFETYVGTRDVAVIHSVADIIGVNAVTSQVYAAAGGYIAGAAGSWRRRRETGASGRRPAIAVSMNGNTTPALMLARKAIEALDYEFLAFHANGVGGRALEDAVHSGNVAAVLDYTLTELSARVVGGLMDPGPHRLEAACDRGIPQIIVPGCVDFITTGPMSEAQSKFPDRTYFAHNPELTLVRLTKGEMVEVAELVAQKLNQATGPVRIYIPMGGFSVPDAPGNAFWDPEADETFVDTLTGSLNSRIEVIRREEHINDPVFIRTILQDLPGVFGLSAHEARPEAVAP